VLPFIVGTAVVAEALVWFEVPIVYIFLIFFPALNRISFIT
jgi:hypothetical protein